MDSGCTDTIVYAPFCEQWTRRPTYITTVGGERLRCDGDGTISVETTTGQRASIPVLVMGCKPIGMDLILGMTGISRLGGVTIESPHRLRFCGVAVSRPPLHVDAPDFSVRFDGCAQRWVVTWKWAKGAGPECLTNSASQYSMPPDVRQDFDKEVNEWISNGWLVPYDETTHGPPRGLIPLMAVRQQNKDKVRPVLDYRELNSHVDAYTAEADVCADQLRRWRRHGSDVAVVDLRKAYLQVHVAEELWCYQTVVVNGTRYCLTRLGFGLNIAPQVMKSVVKAILDQDSDVESAVLPYCDDLLVDESKVSAERVVEHFAAYGLQCKPPERAADGARLLGLRVQPEHGELRWTRDNAVGPPPERLTRRSVFAWCGRVVAHVPVCDWLRPAAAWIKRRANTVTQGWDDVTRDAVLQEQVRYVANRLAAGDDPARGPWCMDSSSATVWVDSSAIAMGVSIQSNDGGIIEDACWLRKDGDTHINMAELDAAVKGINLALAWDVRAVDLRTDSAAVHRWVSDAISGRARLRTKAHGEMLIRRRVSLIRQLVEEFQLSLTVTLVASRENRADSLTRVPKEWLTSDAGAEVVGDDVTAPPSCDVGGEAVACAVTADSADSLAIEDAIKGVHQRAGHPGIRRTLYFVRRDVSRDVTRAAVRDVVRRCETCRSVDPAPVRWRHGSLEVAGVWDRLAIDVTHHAGKSFLSVIDCGPSRFSLWRPLRRADASTVVQQLEGVFYERGAPSELLCDNDTVFRGRSFAAFAARWNVTLRFRAVHEPGGNGVVERSHRTVKVIAARKRCSVAEAVHLYNVSPRVDSEPGSSPASAVYTYQVRDCVSSGDVQLTEEQSAHPVVENECEGGYKVGDAVWVRRRGARCTEPSRHGVVTAVISPQVVEVDGLPWHVRCLRPRADACVDGDADDRHSVDDIPLYVTAREPEAATAPVTPASTTAASTAAPVSQLLPRRGERLRRRPQRFCCEFDF